MKKEKILVIGAGAWGTAIADLIAKNSHEVLLSANHKKTVDEINDRNSNECFLTGVTLNKKVKAIENFDKEIKNCDLVFIAVPSCSVEDIVKKISFLKVGINIGFILCSKGLDHKKLKFFSEIFSEILPLNKFAILSGPNFALEVASEVPTLTNIASINKIFASRVIKILDNDFFVAKYSSDPITVEICGLMKNIIAIGCGMIDELKLGQNTKAALVNRGIEEILILCKKMKGKGDLANPAGFGDIFLTCSSTKSRNNFLGSMLVKQKTYSQIKHESKKTFEGAEAAISIVKLAKKLKLQLILCETIAQIVDSNYSEKQIKSLIIKAIFQK